MGSPPGFSSSGDPRVDRTVEPTAGVARAQRPNEMMRQSWTVSPGRRMRIWTLGASSAAPWRRRGAARSSGGGANGVWKVPKCIGTATFRLESRSASAARLGPGGRPVHDDPSRRRQERDVEGSEPPHPFEEIGVAGEVHAPRAAEHESHAGVGGPRSRRIARCSACVTSTRTSPKRSSSPAATSSTRSKPHRRTIRPAPRGRTSGTDRAIRSSDGRSRWSRWTCETRTASRRPSVARRNVPRSREMRGRVAGEPDP